MKKIIVCAVSLAVLAGVYWAEVTGILTDRAFHGLELLLILPAVLVAGHREAAPDEQLETFTEKKEKRTKDYVHIAVASAAILSAAIWWGLLGNMYNGFLAAASIAVAVPGDAFAIAVREPLAAGTKNCRMQGIVIRDSRILESAWEIDEVVMNKLGTITAGEPVITDIVPVREGFDLRLAAGIEAGSKHPLGQAIVNAALEQPGTLEVFEKFREIPGRGIHAKAGDTVYLAGNRMFMNECSVTGDFGRGYGLAKEGKTVVYFACAGILVGIIALRDSPRTSSLRAVRMMENMGIDVTMLTGDSAGTADAVRREVGIDRVIAQMRPEEKGQIIERLREGGSRKIAMVGYDDSDAEAVQRADLSFVMSTGCRKVLSSYDVFLESGDLCDVARVIQASRRVVSGISQNIALTVCLTVIGTVLASGAAFPVLGIMIHPVLFVIYASTMRIVIQLTSQKSQK
ncbi:MAG: HAD-IC family P-type ATPase [Firmicutes bacterium]|nr:HAD-IC family P-type ATPase [Bacillota bacterium]